LGPRRYGACGANAACGAIVVQFVLGKDCSEVYLFDSTSHRWMATFSGCPAPRCSLLRADVCLPTACIPAPLHPITFDPSNECPPPPDAGAVDAAND
jgi:hypothetical protein